MAQISISEDALRQLLRQAVAAALEDRRDLLRDIVADVIEEVALGEAIRQGRETERASRDEVVAALTDPA